MINQLLFIDRNVGADLTVYWIFKTAFDGTEDSYGAKDIGQSANSNLKVVETKLI